MIDDARVVVSQPLPVVEAMVRDVSTWATLFGEVEEVSRLARDRYVVHLRRGRKVLPALLRVQRYAADHRLDWRTVSGPRWCGELHLVALTGRRTGVHLTVDRSQPAAGAERGAGGLWRRLRAIVPGLAPTLQGPASQGPMLRGPTLQGPTLQGSTLQGPALQGPMLRGRRMGAGQAKRDLHRFRERVDALPRPVRPHRMGPLPGARPVEDLLIVDGLRRRPESRPGQVPVGRPEPDEPA